MVPEVGAPTIVPDVQAPMTVPDVQALTGNAGGGAGISGTDGDMQHHGQ